jgi:hypothetical protein
MRFALSEAFFAIFAVAMLKPLVSTANECETCIFELSDVITNRALISTCQTTESFIASVSTCLTTCGGVEYVTPTVEEAQCRDFIDKWMATLETGCTAGELPWCAACLANDLIAVATTADVAIKKNRACFMDLHCKKCSFDAAGQRPVNTELRFALHFMSTQKVPEVANIDTCVTNNGSPTQQPTTVVEEEEGARKCIADFKAMLAKYDIIIDSASDIGAQDPKSVCVNSQAVTDELTVILDLKCVKVLADYVPKLGAVLTECEKTKSKAENDDDTILIASVSSVAGFALTSMAAFGYSRLTKARAQNEAARGSEGSTASIGKLSKTKTVTSSNPGFTSEVGSVFTV